MKSYQHIMVPVDFSDMSASIVMRAQELAEHYNASLSLLHVVQDMAIGSEPFGEPASLVMYEELRELQLERANTQMQLLADQLKLPLSVAREIREGMTSTTVLAAAEEKAVDLLVIGHSGKKGFFGFMGSTATDVVKVAHCDVLVIRTPKAASQ